MIKAVVLSPLVSVPVEDTGPFAPAFHYTPKFSNDYPGYVSWQDITNYEEPLSDPNLFAYEVLCDQAYLDLLESDGDLFVVSSEEVV